jgi:predicted dehydrogenase
VLSAIAGRAQSPNNKVVLSLIGAGGRGSSLGANFAVIENTEFKSVCEVNDQRGAQIIDKIASIRGKRPERVIDMRRVFDDKDVDGVVVATPEHWHALATVWACQAGKDVYVEKPLTVFIDEGKWMIQAMNKYKRIVVVGTQRNHNPGHQTARKIFESGALGKIQMVKLAAGGRNVSPGFGTTRVSDPPTGFDYDMWLGPAPKRPYQAHRGLYHFRWFWDYSGGQMTNLGAHLIDQIMWIMNVKGPTLVQSSGGRFALEDDGETPDTQDATWTFPGFTMNCTIREANAMRGDPAARGQLYQGTKGSLVLSGGYEVIPENRIDPVNDIPRFQGHPTGGPVYSATKAEPWIAASKGGVSSDARYGTGGEDTMAMNERDWLNSMRTRKLPFCDVADGHRVATTCNLANMSLRLGRAIRWDPDKEVVVGDKEAAAMCVRPYRAPWDGVLRSLVKV